MYVEEEVGHKTATVEVDDWEDAYREVKDILENRFFFHRVEEEKFRHHKDKGIIVSKVNCYTEQDDNTEIEITIVLTIDADDSGGGTVTIDSKGEVVTRYPEDSSWQRHPLYFALRSIWDKLVYGWARGRYEEDAHETLVNVHSALRGAFKSVEA
ncbi:MAG: hypothetical protein MUP63_00620 [Candidatus Nanohaloarchaeota archaeon QJJ-7]|nr:hypothetical protein [Candidatus Nanohaloarchaeota archaeon QJJ-7]